MTRRATCRHGAVATALLAATVGVSLGCSSSSGGATVIVGDAGAEADSGSGRDAGPRHDAGDGGAKPPLPFVPSNLDPASDLKSVALSTLPEVTSTTGDCTVQGGPEAGFSCYTGSGVRYTSRVQPGTQAIIDVFYVDSLTVATGSALRLTDDRPVAIVALHDITLDGALYASNGLAGGAGPASSTGSGGNDNNNGGGGGIDGTSAGSSQGGGGGAYCGTGGPGTANPLSGGATWGGPTLIPLNGGAAGGGRNVACGDAGRGCGGAGGGAVQLVAGGTITIRGVVDVSGGGGGLGGTGGGSGGGVLLEASSVTIGAGAVLAANGGAGSSADAAGSNGAADAGANARGGVGGDAGASGGAGGAGTTANGARAGAEPFDGGAPAGGGGGVGYIRINTATGSATVTGTLSPPTGTCATEGKVAALPGME